MHGYDLALHATADVGAGGRNVSGPAHQKPQRIRRARGDLQESVADHPAGDLRTEKGEAGREMRCGDKRDADRHLRKDSA